MAQTTGLGTLLDVAKANIVSDMRQVIEESARSAPEITGRARRGTTEVSIPGLGFTGEPLEGIDYTTLVCTADPTVNPRDINQGVDYTAPTYENRRFVTYTLNPRWGIDKAAADREKNGPGRLMEMSARAHMRASFRSAASWLYYGYSNSTGLVVPGLKDVIARTDGSWQLARTVDGTGNSADAATSVWAIKWGDDYVRWLMGKNGLWDVSDVSLQQMEDASGKKYTGYHQELWAYIGVQCNTVEAVACIKNLTTQNGKGLTAGLLSQLLSKFNEGFEPDVILMNKQSLWQWQQSLTATSPTGAEAPVPTEFMGIPVVSTPNIVTTEALVTVN